MARSRDSSQGKKRSHACHVDTLVYLRQRKGWTQHELSAAAGYSRRLISKAESGQAISVSAIEVLAEALSIDSDPVVWEDLVCDPVAVAREYFTALYRYQRQSFARIRHLLDEEVVVRASGDPAALPFAGEFRGLAEVERRFELFFAALEAPANRDYAGEHVYVAQGNVVNVSGDSWWHPLDRPCEPVLFSIRLTLRRGKIRLVEELLDTLEWANRLGALTTAGALRRSV